jgi:AAA ATPase-like protein
VTTNDHSLATVGAALLSVHHDGMERAERLVGRNQVRASLRAALEEARAGSGRTVLLSGEPGIGKSALLAWVVDEAAPDAVVLRGFCWEGDGAPPYWPWTQILRATRVPPDELGEAAWLVGGSGTEEPGTAAAAADAQFRVCDAVTQVLLRHASAGRPLVVVLDDLQWADEPSLSLLSFLAHAVAVSPVLVAGAFRDGEASPRLTELSAQTLHLPLAGLTLPEVEALVSAMPGPSPDSQITGRIWERAGGNPFFVRELTQLVQAYGAHDEPSRLPVSVVETVRRRLARLSTECTRLLDWAAVAGRDVDIDLLVATGAAADHVSALDLLGDARRAGMIAGADPLRFTHDIYREAIVAGQPAAVNSEINLALGRVLGARSGSAAQIATHLLRAGPDVRAEAVDYSLRAAREATARLGHDDACGHYQRALALLDDADPRAVEIVLELAAAQGRAGSSDAAMTRYRQAAELSAESADAVGVARAALGMHSLGHRSGALNTAVVDLLGEADRALAARPEQASLHSRVLAALTQALRHGSFDPPDDEDLIAIADRAVRLAEEARDPHAATAALLAVHDAMWAPGTAEKRLPVVARMLDAAETSGDADLVAQAQLLRATALLELGDPDGLDALLAYITLAAALGHARGRWGALTRQATYIAIAGQAEDALQVGTQAWQLGQAIGEPDALGVFGTNRAALALLGVPVELGLLADVAGDPLWPLFPLLRAWPAVVRGDTSAARTALGDFSVQVIPQKYDLELIAIAGRVFAVAGTDEQRRWAYDRLRQYSGRHIVVGGCAAYQGAVDHVLNKLAAALNQPELGVAHLRAALEQYERLGAAGFTRLAESELAVSAAAAPASEFRFADGLWRLDFAGQQAQLPDAKGMHDIAMLLSAPGTEVHVLDLLGVDGPKLGADPVLDDIAKAQYRARLKALAEELDAADARGDEGLAKRLTAEQETILAELSRASGLGGRPRRLGDAGEKARKTVGARVRDALVKLDRVHPELAGHLRGAVRLGTTCSYTPAQPIRWQVS